MKNVKTKEEFNDILKNEQSVVLKFSAEWCQPCKTVTNYIEEIENDEKFKNIKFLEADISDINDDFSNEYKVRSIPLLIFFKNGEKINSTLGAITKEKIIENINNIF